MTAETATTATPGERWAGLPHLPVFSREYQERSQRLTRKRP